MASHEVTPQKSDKTVNLDDSFPDSTTTIDLSSSSNGDDSFLDSTVNLSDEEGNSVNNTSHAADVGSEPKDATSQPEVFSFVGADHTREESPFPGEPPIKRPHSPESLEPENIKRKCEEQENALKEKLTLSLNMNNSTGGQADSTAEGMIQPSGIPGDWQMPSTVTKLVSPSGGEVYLVGTAHFSQESQEDVAKVIQMVQPHIVTVELCKSRINLLQLDEKTILEEAQNINLAKVRATVQQNGLFNGLMYILLLTMSAHLTRELGMAPGGEFRRAFREARQVPHCSVHLGDRPIQITLQRALSSLTWWQTTKLTWHILTSKDPISKEEVEKCKQRDLLEEMLAEMTGEFPALSHVFVHERDLFLAHSLALAAMPIPTPFGTMPARVVGVVGIGHVPGIVQHWGKVGEDDITPIMRVPPPSLTSRVLKLTVKVTAVGLVVWGAYKILPLPRVAQIQALWK